MTSSCSAGTKYAKQGTDRVLPVLLDIARDLDVLRQVHAVVSQRDLNATPDVSRAALVVNGIEGGDQVKSAPVGPAGRSREPGFKSQLSKASPDDLPRTEQRVDNRLALSNG